MASHGLRRAILVQGLANGAVSLAGLFIPFLAKDLGATDLQVGLIGACYGASFFTAAWVFGRLADMGRRAQIIRLGLLVTALAAPLPLFAHGPWGLAAARALFGFACGIFPAALIAYAYDAQRRPGRFAGWGALGMGIGSVLAGLLDGGPWTFTIAAGGLGVAFLLALRLEPRPEARVKVPWLPREVIAKNMPAYLAIMARHIGAASVWVIFPLYLAQLGASPTEIGLLYFLNTGCQFLFMGLLDRFPAGPLVLAGLFSSSFVFLLFWAAPVWWFVVPIQLLLALAWALLYVGALAWVMERNVERATSTGLLQSSLSLSNIVGPVLGGFVSFYAGYGATMLVAAFLCLLGVPLFLFSSRHAARREKERSARDVVLLKEAEAQLLEEEGLSETV